MTQTLPQVGQLITWRIWSGQYATARVLAVASDGGVLLRAADGFVSRKESLPREWTVVA